MEKLKPEVQPAEDIALVTRQKGQAIIATRSDHDLVSKSAKKILQSKETDKKCPTDN